MVREYINAEAGDDSYEQIFGAVDPETGEVQDTLDKSISQRADGDRYVYNGGTITNHRSDTVTTVVRKIWNASAFQSQLEDVTLESPFSPGRCARRKRNLRVKRRTGRTPASL